MKKTLSIALLALLPFGVLACGDDDDHGSHVTPPECEAIGEGCHESETPMGIECHEKAHDEWTAAECTAMSAGCLAECAPAADAGPDAQ